MANFQFASDLNQPSTNTDVNEFTSPPLAYTQEEILRGEDLPKPTDVASSPEPAAYNIDVNSDIQSTELANAPTLDEARTLRSQLQQKEQSIGSIGDIKSDVGTPQLFNDPTAYIKDQLFGDQELSVTEAEYRRQLRENASFTEGIAGDIQGAQRGAERRIGLTGLEAELAKTNEKIAQRTTRFRRELRAYEADPERRGVSRASFIDERNKLEADATAELADLYIIQNAQQGNVTAARSYINTAVENKYKAIEIELTQRQARINELLPTLEKEEKQKALQLQLALTERQNNIESEKANEKIKRDLVTEAAANGAPESVLTEIINASSVNSAMLKSAPYVGLLERQAAARAAQSASLANRKALMELALKGDTSAMKQLGKFGEELQAQLDAEKTEEERLRFEKTVNNAYEIQGKLAIAERIANSPAFEASTGSVQNNPFLKIGGGALAGGGTMATVGSVVPGLGTLTGGVIGTIAGAGTATRNYLQTERAKETLFDDVEAITSRETLQTLIDAKAEGATFGALSEAELDLLIQATNALSSKIVYEPGTSTVIGFSGTPESVQSAMNEVTKYYKKAQDKNFTDILGDEDKNQLYSLYK